MDPSILPSLKTAICVCGHAIYHGGPHLSPSQVSSDDYWQLQSFQKGEPPHYISHIRTGVTLAAEHPDSLLIFSGGQTRPPHILSEAQGYHNIATVFDYWGHHQVRARTTTEEFACDSYDNVLFSIARFKECVGIFPHRLIVVSWGFKRDRFQCHASTIQWPLPRFQFVGVGVPDDLEQARRSEAKTLQHFKLDPTGYGTHAGNLAAKKRARNPYKRQHGYAVSCPDMFDILAWRAHCAVPLDHVPWA